MTTVRAFAVFAAFAMLVLSPVFSWADARVALLIGNNAYSTSPLRNAVNDAGDLGATLRELGFKTIVKTNTSRADMIAAIREFGVALEGAETALFFYAGHAMQFKDRNYLIPVDAVMASEDDVTFFSVEVAQIFDRMVRARTRFNFVILDACRDNPFRDTFKVTASGLAQMSGPSGTLIAYATAPGATAADGFGRNGVYTGQILKNIRIPDMPVEVLFRKVREGVERDTKRLQTPWELSSIKGDFVFNATGRAEAAGAPPTGGAFADVSSQHELMFWKGVQDSLRAGDVQAYLDKYPDGVFAALARKRIDTLLGRSSSPATAASPATAIMPAQSGVVSPSAPAAGPGREAESAGAVDRPPKAIAESPPEVLALVAPTAVMPGTSPATGSAGTDAPAPATVAAAKPKDELPGREIAPGIRELTFADGSVYVGAMRGVQPDGKGRYTSKAFRYEGEFRNGRKEGSGVYIWENGDRYEGEFSKDRPNGKGRYQFASGDSYEGDVKAGAVDGRGVYTTRTGDRIEGWFVDGQAEGVGIYRFASGDRYEGELVRGKPHGQGRYLARSGDRIEGQFVDGVAQGKGVYYFSNRDRYEGDLRGGALTGVGSYHYASGQKYEGQVADGRPQGKGTFWFADGSRFEGEFSNGLARATGMMIGADDTRSAAEIVDGAVRLLK